MYAVCVIVRGDCAILCTCVILCMCVRACACVCVRERLCVCIVFILKSSGNNLKVIEKN